MHPFDIATDINADLKAIEAASGLLMERIEEGVHPMLEDAVVDAQQRLGAALDDVAVALESIRRHTTVRKEAQQG